MNIFRAAVIFLLCAAGSLPAQRLDTVRFEKSFTAGTSRPLEIFLEMDVGEIYLDRGTGQTGIDLTVSYTRDEFKERIDFDADRNRLSIELKKRGWKKTGDSEDERNHSSVRLMLPRGVEIYLDSRLKAGVIDMNLGGIRLKELTLSNWAGEADIRFDEPNPVIMEYMDINAKVGEFNLSGLGNARFKHAKINGGIGELRVDFSGALLPAAGAEVDLDIGSASVYLPEDRGIRMSIGGMFSFMSSKDIDSGFRKRGRAWYNDRYRDDAEAFRLRITPGLGELRVRLN